MFLLFFVLWLILNGAVTVQTVVTGLIISAVLLLFMCKFMRYSVSLEKKLFRGFPKLVKIFLVLLVEVIKSSFALLPYIYSSEKKPAPVVVRLRADKVKTELGQVILADCITMTPGTITGSLKDGEYLIHCIDKSMASGLSDGVFVKAISEWEEK